MIPLANYAPAALAYFHIGYTLVRVRCVARRTCECKQAATENVQSPSWKICIMFLSVFVEK